MKKIMKSLLMASAMAFILFGVFGCADPASALSSSDPADPTGSADDTLYPVTITIEGAEESETVISDVTEGMDTTSVTLSVENLGTGRQVILSAVGRAFGSATVRKDGYETFLMQQGPLEIIAVFSDMPQYAITINNGGDYFWRERELKLYRKHT